MIVTYEWQHDVPIRLKEEIVDGVLKRRWWELCHSTGVGGRFETEAEARAAFGADE